MCFGLQTDPTKTPFGFLNGQIRHNAIITSAGWYNFGGQKLGYGDLSIQDIAKISLSISADDIFFVLSEGDSFWNLPKEFNSSEPGTKYVIANASWVITTSIIVRSRTDIRKAEKVSKDGIEYVRIPRHSVEEVLTAPKIPPQDTINKIETDPPFTPPKKVIKKPRTIHFGNVAPIPAPVAFPVP